MIRVKVCCISSREEADLAIRYGAAALGLVSSMPSGPGVISDPMIRSLTRHIPPGVDAFLLTSETRAEAIIRQQQSLRANTVQIVDELTEGSHEDIRHALPGIGVVQVLHVLDESTLGEAKKISDSVDAILLDSGNPNMEVKELGGTGRTHNWEISKAIVEAVTVPVFLAGGLKAENVGDAIRIVRPYGLDLCSGVRTQGKLDERKLAAFFDAVRKAS